MVIRVQGNGWTGGHNAHPIADKLFHLERIGLVAGKKHHRFIASKMKHRTMIAEGFIPNKPYRK